MAQIGAQTPSDVTQAESQKPRPFGTGYKLIGHDYSTNDLVAKVTGKSKYAEDFRAEGMLFCRLVLSPMPHARVKSINADKALALPGVRGILTPSEVPGHADYINDNGTTIKADKYGELALADQPMYQGEPILAVAAVDELTAANAIELIDIEMEPLPFNTDPLESLRPGSANAREDGNVWVREDDRGPMKLTSLKWTDEDFAAEKEGRMPMGQATEHWSYGDVDAGMKNAALILDETFLTPDVSHQCLEPRTTMAYWQNGKLYLYTGTQSTFQTVPAIARWMHMDEDKIVFISEYTGGGFGSKITGALTLVIPALLSKKLNAPVMMRISREEEHYIGRARPGIRSRTKVGFAKDGRITAVDMFLVSDAGSYGSNGDGGACASITSLLYQPPAMRWRNVTVATNTPPRSAQSAPGGMQAIAIFEPIMSKAARKLGLDQVAIRRINSPEGQAEYGPPNPRTGKRGHVTSCFLKQALDEGAKQFNWSQRVARQPKQIGSKIRGVGVALSTYHGGSSGFDGLILITPQGRVQIHSGVGNLGTEAFIDVHRAAAEVLDVPWEAVDIVWGDTSKHLPYTCASGGSQTVHAMTRAGFAVGTECVQRLKEVAAKSLGGSPDNYEVANQRVSRKGGGAGMSFAQAAQAAIKMGGIYDGHDVNPEVHKATKQAANGLAGQGLIATAKDTYPHEGDSMSFLACFAEVEVDVETGKYYITDYLGYADVGTVLHPAALGGQVLGRSTLGIGHAIGQKWVIDPQYGVTVAERFYQNRPPTILDVPVDMKWNALNIPDPQTPVGARGCGEPPVGGGCASILNAISDAVGDSIFQRAPVNSDTILTSYEAGRPMQNPLLAHI
jgi:xanthine dehydrogenase molybdenum-binding subunit